MFAYLRNTVKYGRLASPTVVVAMTTFSSVVYFNTSSNYILAENKKGSKFLYTEPKSINLPIGSIELDTEAPMRKRMEALIRRTQDEICTKLEAMDGGTFKRDHWIRKNDGGEGITRCLQGGTVFEKAGVNISIVQGNMGAAAVQHMKTRGKEIFSDDTKQYPYFACGISLVLHPHNPMAPTIHMNYRYFEIDSGRVDDTTGKPIFISWFGGGADLSPSFVIDADARHFHAVYQSTLDAFDTSLYPKMKKDCDDYFYIPHRQEHRGLGGIFFDDMEKNPELHFAMTQACCNAFFNAYIPILERRMDSPATPAQKEWQQIRRGRYVEFNLMYDRGTKFGLATPAARIESILMSLPLTCRFEYMNEPKVGSWEHTSLEEFKGTRDWLGYTTPEIERGMEKVDLEQFSTSALLDELAKRGQK